MIAGSMDRDECGSALARDMSLSRPQAASYRGASYPPTTPPFDSTNCHR